MGSSGCCQQKVIVEFPIYDIHVVIQESLLDSHHVPGQPCVEHWECSRKLDTVLPSQNLHCEESAQLSR